ncbi:MAG: hypothetical protein J2P54_16545 [Bradyrhizobiaceae bacterium]|nr:hypothetical protein [Bradyrhizobiaceae bacterium]
MGDSLVPIGLSRGCKVFALRNWLEVGILIEEADGAKIVESPRTTTHSWLGHYCSARAFAVNPARLKARPYGQGD